MTKDKILYRKFAENSFKLSGLLGFVWVLSNFAKYTVGDYLKNGITARVWDLMKKHGRSIDKVELNMKAEGRSEYNDIERKELDAQTTEIGNLGYPSFEHKH